MRTWKGGEEGGVALAVDQAKALTVYFLCAGTPLLVVREEGEDAEQASAEGPEAAVASPVPPAPSEPLPALMKLLGSRDPSPVLQWHLLDIL